MLKLNAAYSKKVPAEGEYTSQSYHASIEVELPDGLSQEQLNDKIHATFAMVRESVEAELGESNARKSTELPVQETTPQNNRSAAVPASPKQIKYLLDLARQYNVSPDQIKAKFNVPALESLTKTQCSRAIDELSGKAA